VTTTTTGLHHGSGYQPMPNAKTSNYKFNYEKPTEYFHPDMKYTTGNQFRR